MTDLVPEWAVRLQRTADTIRQQTLAVLNRHDDLEAIMAVTQQQIDAYAAAVGTYASGVQAAVDGLRADIEALKAANPEVDTSALDARLAELGTAAGSLQALDAENPPAAPTP